MKAIQIKFLPLTATKDNRLKAWTSGGSITEPRNSAIRVSVQAQLLAIKLAKKLEWKVTLGYPHTLPNEDFVCCIEEVVG